jgi:hypothetical protein
MKVPRLGSLYRFEPPRGMTFALLNYAGGHLSRGEIVRAIGVPGMRGRAPAPWQHIERVHDGAIGMIYRSALQPITSSKQ